MKVFNFPQLSSEWWAIRRGVPTASEFGRIMTPAKKQYAAGALAYACELAAELLDPLPPHLSASGMIRTIAMANGQDTEPEARRFYALERDCDVREVGFCLTDDGRYGCSPDGLVGEDGGLELKVPLPKTHALWLYRGGLPDEHRCQVHGQLIVTGRAYVDFLSYSPGLPPLLVRVEPDAFTVALRACLEVFAKEYADVRRKLGCPDLPVYESLICEGA